MSSERNVKRFDRPKAKPGENPEGVHFSRRLPEVDYTDDYDLDKIAKPLRRKRTE